MGTYLDTHEVVNRKTGGNSGLPQNLDWHKEPRVAGAAAVATATGQPVSLWEYEGQPSHGAVPPASIAYPGSSTQGGLKQNDPGGGRSLLISALGVRCDFTGTVVLYDRLAHISGLSGIVTTPQTVGASAITRYTNGLGNFIAYEIYTTIGVTGTTITANYTNQAATSGLSSTAAAFGATNSREAQRLRIIPLAAGDTGVQAVASVTVTANTGTAGNFGIVVGHRLAEFNLANASVSDIRSFLDGSFLDVSGACLCWYYVPAGAVNVGFDMWATMEER